MKERGEIGLYLGVLLAERNMNQLDLAKRCGVSAAYLSEIFLGRKNLGPKSIPKIAAALESKKSLREPILYRLNFLAACEYGFVVSEFRREATTTHQRSVDRATHQS